MFRREQEISLSPGELARQPVSFIARHVTGVEIVRYEWNAWPGAKPYGIVNEIRPTHAESNLEQVFICLIIKHEAAHTPGHVSTCVANTSSFRKPVVEYAHTPDHTFIEGRVGQSHTVISKRKTNDALLI